MNNKIENVHQKMYPLTSGAACNNRHLNLTLYVKWQTEQTFDFVLAISVSMVVSYIISEILDLGG